MKIAELIEKLSLKINFNSKDISNNAQIYEIEELDSDSSKGKLKNDILYFVHDATCLGTAIPQNLVFAGDAPALNRATFVNALQISPCDYEKAINNAHEILNKAYRMQSFYSSMLRNILDGKNISGILNDIADRANTSVIIIDMSGKIFAHSVPLRLENRLWFESVQQGYCPTEFMEHIQKLREENGCQPNSSPYVRYCEEMQLYYLCSQIVRGDAVFGYSFIIQPGREFDTDCYQMLSLVSKTLTEIVSKNQDRITLNSHLYGEILTDMLNGISEKQAATRIHVSKLMFPSYMRVLMVKSLYYHGEVSFAGSIQPQLEHIFQVEHSIVYRNAIVLIVEVQKNRLIPQEQMEQLEAFCKKNYLLAGISNSFTEPEKFQEYYRQAEKAIIISKRMEEKDSVHDYQDDAFFDMLEALPRDLRLMNYCYPVLPLLRDYDQRRGTKLYETLRVYTLSGFNQNKAADLLFLHRNTMNYRRQKIMDLFKIDLEDPHTQFLLSYSFYIDLFQEKIK